MRFTSNLLVIPSFVLRLPPLCSPSQAFAVPGRPLKNQKQKAEAQVCPVPTGKIGFSLHLSGNVVWWRWRGDGRGL